MDEVSRRTLEHYDQRAEDFWRGTRDHDVRQNIDALLERDRGRAAVRDPRFRLRAGPRPEGVHGPGPRRRSAWKARRALPPWRASTAAAKCWSRISSARSAAGALRRRVRQRGAVPRARAAELPRVLRRAARGAQAGRRAVQLESARRQRGRLEPGRYGVYHDLEAWRRYLTAAGFAELRPLLPPAGTAARAAALAGERLASAIMAGHGTDLVTLRAGDRAGADHAVRAPRGAQVQARAEHLSRVLPVDGR